MSAEIEVLATLDEYAGAYCAKDIDRLIALFDDGDDISVIGTGLDELCSGRSPVRALFERNFAEASATEFTWQWTQVTVRDSTAVVATSLHIDLTIEGEPHRVPLRWTVVLRRDARGEWRWLHRHASAAAGGQDAGTAYPTN